MSSLRKLASNRRNSLKSTGPRTVQGKNRSRFNALSSRIYAATLLLPGENHQEYEARRQEIIDALTPCGELEEFHANQIVADMWRLSRLQRGEKLILGSDVQWHANCRTEPPEERKARISHQNTYTLNIGATSAATEELRKRLEDQSKQSEDLRKQSEERFNSRMAIPIQDDVDAAFANSIVDPSKFEISEKIERMRNALMRRINHNILFLVSLQERRLLLIGVPDEGPPVRQPAGGAPKPERR